MPACRISHASADASSLMPSTRLALEVTASAVASVDWSIPLFAGSLNMSHVPLQIAVRKHHNVKQVIVYLPACHHHRMQEVVHPNGLR